MQEMREADEKVTRHRRAIEEGNIEEVETAEMMDSREPSGSGLSEDPRLRPVKTYQWTDSYHLAGPQVIKVETIVYVFRFFVSNLQWYYKFDKIFKIFLY